MASPKVARANLLAQARGYRNATHQRRERSAGRYAVGDVEKRTAQRTESYRGPALPKTAGPSKQGFKNMRYRAERGIPEDSKERRAYYERTKESSQQWSDRYSLNPLTQFESSGDVQGFSTKEKYWDAYYAYIQNPGDVRNRAALFAPQMGLTIAEYLAAYGIS